MQNTEEQQAIDDFVAAGKGNLVVDALAGSGKTHTMLGSLVRLPQPTALMCAFNKSIADELTVRLPRLPRGKIVHVKTFHSAGLGILKAHFPRVQIDRSATEDLVNRAAGHAIAFKLRRAAVDTLRTLKETYAEPDVPTSEQINALALEYDHFKKISTAEAELCVDVIRDAYILSLDLARRDTIDFCDMVWAPVVLGLAPKSRYKAIFVDELQDISRPQLKMLRMLMASDGRFIGIGDKNQQIYGWRGSMGPEVWAYAKTELNAKFLPLTITWRCAQAIVKEAQAIVPKIRARPDAPAGHVQTCSWDGLPNAIQPKRDAPRPKVKPPGKGRDLEIPLSAEKHTFVLSRSNASLLDCALYLWVSKVGFELNAGKELLDPLFALLDYKLDMRGKEPFLESLRAWEEREIARAEKANATAYAERIEEQADMLRVAATYVAPTGIKQLLLDIMTPNDSGVMLSTVHKVKGLEAERVFLLKQTFQRHDERACKFCSGYGDDVDGKVCNPCNGSGRWIRDLKPEELNIEYVAITRAISRLVWVDMTKSAGLTVSGARAVARGLVDDQVMGDRTEGEIDRVTRGLLGIKTEAEQLVDAAAQFPLGIPRHLTGAALTVRGDHARDQIDAAIDAHAGGYTEADEEL